MNDNSEHLATLAGADPEHVAAAAVVAAAQRWAEKVLAEPVKIELLRGADGGIGGRVGSDALCQD